MAVAAATLAPGNMATAKVKGGKKKLSLIILAGLWFSGMLPGLPGMAHKPAKAEGKPAGKEAVATPHAQVFVELPEMISNLDSSGGRARYVKLKTRFELAAEEDQAAFTAAQPRVVDLVATYLRETHPEELQERVSTDRLREELVIRANILAAPARIMDVQFSELIVQ